MVVLVEYYNQHKKIHSATTHLCEISQSENVVDKITENAKKKRKSMQFKIYSQIPLILTDMKKNMYLELLEYLLGVMKQQLYFFK